MYLKYFLDEYLYLKDTFRDTIIQDTFPIFRERDSYNNLRKLLQLIEKD